MSISALFFNFSKRKNSLKVPVDNTGTVFDVTLKQPCSYQEPVLTLSNSGFSYNYAKFEGAYYFVSDKVSLRAGLWEIHLKKDVLATWRSAILAQSAYVLYDTDPNTEVSDTRLSVDTVPTYVTNSNKFTTLSTSTEYTAIVGVIGSSKNGSNSSGLYALSINQVNSLLRNMFSFYIGSDGLPDMDFSSVTDTKETLQEMGDFIARAARQFMCSSDGVGSNLKSVRLTPVPLSSLDGTVKRIYLGLYDTGIDGLMIDMDPFVDGCTINIPWQASDWRRNSPYHEFYLNIPFLGTINISPSSIAGLTKLDLYMYVDVSDGTATIVIYKDFANDNILGIYTTNIGGEYLIGSTGITPARGIMAITGAAASVAATAFTGSAIPATAIPAIMNNITPQSTAVGGSGGLSAIQLLRRPVTLTSVFHDTNIVPTSVSSVMGTPAMAAKTIGSLTGYCQTAGFSLDAAAPDGDRVEVNSLMNSGVFIE